MGKFKNTNFFITNMKYQNTQENDVYFIQFAYKYILCLMIYQVHWYIYIYIYIERERERERERDWDR